MTTANPTPPIFVFEGNDVGIFGSLADAQNQIEPTDVSNGVYTGFDSNARLLTISTDGRNTFITLAQPEISQPDVLESRLRKFLQHTGDSGTLEDYDLGRLVEVARGHVHLPKRSRGLFRRAD